MLIVLEGTDRAGKTTLAQMLEDAAAARGIEVTRIHKGAPTEENGILEYESPLEKLLDEVLSEKHLIICDRWHLGERVYGPLLRKKSIVTPAQAVHIEMFLQAVGAMRIIVAATKGTLTDRFRTDLGRTEAVTVLQAKFVNSWMQEEGRRLMWQVIDTSNGVSAAQVAALLKAAETVVTLVPKLGRTPGIIGNTMFARTLIVGDKRNDGPRSQNELYPRAFTPARDPSGSAVLMNAIAIGKLTSTSAVVNANEADIAAVYEAFKSQNRGISVIALGSEAAAACYEADVPCQRVPHPAYWCRFRFGEEELYATKLLEASVGAP